MTLDFDPVFETERRFLVSDVSVVEGANFEDIEQAYVFAVDDFAIRVRLITTVDPDDHTVTRQRAFLTGKGPRFGIKREEYDFEVDPLWAHGVIDRAESVIRKRRYQVIRDQTWDVDEFFGDNAGLWIAEIEGGPEVAAVRRPSWCSAEITSDNRYNNENLVTTPHTAFI